MKQAFLLLVCGSLMTISSCTKSDNTFTGTVLYGQPNHYDSMILNTSSYTLLYQGDIYTYVPTSPPTSNYYTLTIKYNGSNITDATYTYNSYTTLEISAIGGIFQSSLYVGK